MIDIFLWSFLKLFRWKHLTIFFSLDKHWQCAITGKFITVLYFIIILKLQAWSDRNQWSHRRMKMMFSLFYLKSAALLLMDKTNLLWQERHNHVIKSLLWSYEELVKLHLLSFYFFSNTFRSNFGHLTMVQFIQFISALVSPNS